MTYPAIYDRVFNQLLSTALSQSKLFAKPLPGFRGGGKLTSETSIVDKVSETHLVSISWLSALVEVGKVDVRS